MPITFTVSPDRKTIYSRTVGTISYRDVVDHLAAKVRAGMLGRAELFDARGMTLDLSLQGLHQIAEESRRLQGGHAPGPVAVVTDSRFIHGLARAYAAMIEDENAAFEVFYEVDEARKWLAEVATRSPAGSSLS